MHRPIPLNRQVENITSARRKVSDTSFKGVLLQCSNKILHVAKYQKDNFFVFEVPAFIVGYPVFDRDACVRYLIRYLKQMKFQVEQLPPHTLCIAWNKNIPVTDIVNNATGSSGAAPDKSAKTLSDKQADQIDELIRTMHPAKQRKPKKDPIAERPPLKLIKAMSRK